MIYICLEAIPGFASTRAVQVQELKEAISDRNAMQIEMQVCASQCKL
jgi:hypothetical protein